MLRIRLVPFSVFFLLVGCVGQTPDLSDDGFYTWVDETGQVRHERIPHQDPDEADADAEETETDSEKSGPVTMPDEVELVMPPGFDEEATEDDRQPYFTWRDAEGNLRYDFYEPETDTRPIHDRREEPGLSSAQITRRGDAGLSPDADPQAASIMGLDSRNRLDIFAESCCQELDRSGVSTLPENRGQEFVFDRDSPRHEFATGESRYALARIPQTDKDVLRIRSFIRDGAFLPTVVLLDRDFEPVRMITDIAFDHTPETWRRYGHLEARLPWREQGNERWILLITRETDVVSQTRIEAGSPAAGVQIEHQPTGHVELRLR